MAQGERKSLRPLNKITKSKQNTNVNFPRLIYDQLDDRWQQSAISSSIGPSQLSIELNWIELNWIKRSIGIAVMTKKLNTGAAKRELFRRPQHLNFTSISRIQWFLRHLHTPTDKALVKHDRIEVNCGR